jgi:hypothetical protein
MLLAMAELASRIQRLSGVNHEVILLLKCSAEANYLPAQCQLGVCLLDQGPEQDLHEAIRLLRAAASSGFLMAQYHLAQCYENGQGAAKDILRAACLYELAAQRGHAEANSALSRLALSQVDIAFGNLVLILHYRSSLKALLRCVSTCTRKTKFKHKVTLRASLNTSRVVSACSRPIVD